MKVNLLYKSNNILSGFINIDPFTSEEDIQSGKKIQGVLDDLNWVVEDSECTQIIAEDAINYFGGEAVDRTLDNWVKKLRHKGTIIIGGVDLYEVCRGISTRYIDLAEANLLLYGQDGEKKSVLSGSHLVDALKSLGLKTVKYRINSYKYTIESQRP